MEIKDQKLNEICTKLLTISKDKNIKEIYRKWCEEARKYIYEK